jgi:hypothetical protein
VLNVLDMAKLIDGKVTTASLPCPGVNVGIIGVYKSNKTIGVTWAWRPAARCGLVRRALHLREPVSRRSW